MSNGAIGANGFGNGVLRAANGILRNAEQQALSNPQFANDVQNGHVNLNKFLNDPNNPLGQQTLQSLQSLYGQMTDQQKSAFLNNLTCNANPNGGFDGGNHGWLYKMLSGQQIPDTACTAQTTQQGQ
jgi:hypothetical protein